MSTLKHLASTALDLLATLTLANLVGGLAFLVVGLIFGGPAGAVVGSLVSLVVFLVVA